MKPIAVFAWFVLAATFPRFNSTVMDFLTRSTDVVMRTWPGYQSWHLITLSLLYTLAHFVLQSHFLAMILVGLLADALSRERGFQTLSCARSQVESERAAFDAKRPYLYFLLGVTVLCIALQAYHAVAILTSAFAPHTPIVIHRNSTLSDSFDSPRIVVLT